MSFEREKGTEENSHFREKGTDLHNCKSVSIESFNHFKENRLNKYLESIKSQLN